MGTYHIFLVEGHSEPSYKSRLELKRMSPRSFHRNKEPPLLVELSSKRLGGFRTPSGSFHFRISPKGLLSRVPGVEYDSIPVLSSEDAEVDILEKHDSSDTMSQTLRQLSPIPFLQQLCVDECSPSPYGSLDLLLSQVQEPVPHRVWSPLSYNSQWPPVGFPALTQDEPEKARETFSLPTVELSSSILDTPECAQSQFLPLPLDIPYTCKESGCFQLGPHTQCLEKLDNPIPCKRCGSEFLFHSH